MSKQSSQINLSTEYIYVQSMIQLCSFMFCLPSVCDPIMSRLCTFCLCSIYVCHSYVFCPGWQGLAGFRGPQQNPSELSESAYLQIFATKTLFFTIAGKQAICGCQKTCTHTGTFPQTPFLMFRYVLWLCTGCTKALQKWALQKLYESRLYESSLKALRKLSESSLKAL